MTLIVNNLPGKESGMMGFQDVVMLADAINTNETNIAANTAAIAGGVIPATIKKYIALMSEAGTAAPTADTVLLNTIGAIVWTRTGVGVYVGTLAGAFLSGKVPQMVGIISNAGVNWQLKRLTDNTVELKTLDGIGGAAADVLLSNTLVSFIVIP